MAWESRNGRHYFYRSVWIDGQAVKQYVGCGAEARQAATEIEDRRLLKIAENREFSEISRQLAAPLLLTQQLTSASKLLFEARLFSDGKHNTSWRWKKRKRGTQCS